MAEISRGWLAVEGPDGSLRRMQLLSSGEGSRHLAVVLPGVTYNAAMPVLYYPARVMLAHEADVLKVDYGLPMEDSATPDIEAVGAAALQMSLAAVKTAIQKCEPARLTLIGKSLGTVAMAGLLSAELSLPRTDCIWITPLVKNAALVEQMAGVRQMSLVVAGTKDPHSDAKALDRLEKEAGMHVIQIEDANHSVEIEGNVIASLRGLQRMVRAIDEFMGWGDMRRWWVWS